MRILLAIIICLLLAQHAVGLHLHRHTEVDNSTNSTNSTSSSNVTTNSTSSSNETVNSTSPTNETANSTNSTNVSTNSNETSPSNGTNAIEVEGNLTEGLDLSNADEAVVQLLQKAQEDFNQTVHSGNEEKV